jgi:hypothetical protein
VPIPLTSFNGLILTFLIGEYGGTPHAAKRLARLTQASPRAAENWLAGLNAPSGDRLADLVAAHPDLEAKLLEEIHERRASLRQRSEAAAAESRARLSARSR